MEEKEKKLLVPFERQGYNMCSETSMSMWMKYLNKEFDVNQDGESNQWDIQDMIPGQCTYFWDILPCMNEFLDCELKQHQSIEDLKAEIDKGQPAMLRIRPRWNLPGEHHSVLVVGYKGDTILVHDPAGEKFEKVSKKRLLREWKATKNAVIMCKNKE